MFFWKLYQLCNSDAKLFFQICHPGKH
jgi:hypothetical protein